MKTSVQFTLTLFVVIIFGFNATAQVTLPYYSGFNTSTELMDWSEYHLFPNNFSEWQTNSMNGYEGSGYIAHDYAPSTGVNLVDDWYVSPEFTIPNGGTLDSTRYKFSGFSTPLMGDTIAIYLLNGSQDPSLASSVTLLYDFRDTSYNADNIWHLLTDINLSASSEASYIGFRYRSNDVSAQWLTVGFDNFAVSANPNVGQEELDKNTWSLYPNPSTGKFRIEAVKEIQTVKIYTAIGEVVYSNSKFDEETFIEIDLSEFSKGIYFVRMDDQLQKIMIN